MPKTYIKEPHKINASSQELLINRSGLSQILLNMGEAVISTDTKGRITSMNKLAEQLTGWKQREAIGKPIESIYDAIDENSMTPSPNPIKVALLNDRKVALSNHTILINKNKSQHVIVDSAIPLHNNNKEMIGGALIFRDVTEQSIKDKKLIENEGLIKDLMEKLNLEMKEKLKRNLVISKSRVPHEELMKNMPGMFFVLDNSLRFKRFNHACEVFTTKKQEKVIGKLINNILPVDDYFIENCKKVLETGKSRNFNSGFIINEIRSTFIVNIYLIEKGISVIMTDISKQKQSEMETLELLERLQKANKDLRLSASTISHDLRGPITRILGLVSLYQLDPMEKLDDKSILDCVADEITDLDNVVTNINDTISFGEDEKIQQYLYFENEFTLVKKVLENQISESKAVFITDFHECESILTVKSYLYSIIYNLVSNAIKYRSVTVPLVVNLKSKLEDGFICFSVSDNGLGIDMKKNGDKVFGLYNRFHKTIEGKGIGLNLVKVHAELLGGKVDVESKVNEGTVFKIFFPIDQKK